MDAWNFNAPNSDLFSIQNEKEYSDSYFDTVHEIEHHSVKTVIQEESVVQLCQMTSEIKIKQEAVTPVAPKEANLMPPPDAYNEQIKTERMTPRMETLRSFRRRSMSVNAIMENIKDIGNTVNELKKAITNNSSPQSSNGSTCNIKTFSSLNNLNLHQQVKYRSDAERIYYFQKNTPDRFHTVSKVQDGRALNAAFNRKKVQQLRTTVPQSPALLAKTRTRPVTALSQKELEEMEVKEIKSYHIKAQPISKAVTQGILNLAPVQRRPVTQPEPFNLTQVRKKPVQPEAKHVFKAQPVPKHILEKPAELPKKQPIPITVPKTPNIKMPRSRSLDNVSKSSNGEDNISLPRRVRHCPLKTDRFEGMVPNQGKSGHSGVPLPQKVVLHPCKPKPFSFEQRDKERELMKKKKIQQFYEEEKKLREFHANPIPIVVLKKSVKIQPIPSFKHSERKVETKKENKENATQVQTHAFKARPPYILSKEPFKPILQERPLLEPCQVQLTTEKRAKEREEYNQMLREKEEKLDSLKKMVEEEKKVEEEKEIASLRMQLVHKAGPVKHYPPFVVHPSNAPLTMPATPKFASHRHA